MELSNLQIIRKAECDEDGELYVTLCQKAGTGHWTGRNMGWMNADDYESDKTYIEKVGESNGDS
ncbi:hypothetical protein [Salibacterium salarium]|uniref:hypothetical protein n=1 Tax=Salibacterium salarium TaxID=284579 RepID=UPI000F772DC5|nr:hypothetical protein [Salibacterium salarium]